MTCQKPKPRTGDLDPIVNNCEGNKKFVHLQIILRSLSLHRDDWWRHLSIDYWTTAAAVW